MNADCLTQKIGLTRKNSTVKYLLLGPYEVLVERNGYQKQRRRNQDYF